MPQAKIELAIGNVTFSGEGDDAWLAEQLEKVIDVATTLAAQSTDAANLEPDVSDAAATPEGGDGDGDSGFTVSLVSYIREKHGESNQVRRFLATADWLRRRGVANLTSSAVAKALADNHQKRLANAPDCLNKNVSKGYCEKTKTGFFITPDGLKHLGHQ